VNEFEIDTYRAAMIFNHFEKIHTRLIDGELDYGEGEWDIVNIGDPYDHSMRASLGYMEDSKYGIHLSWCSIHTVTLGEIQRYIATIDRSRDSGEIVYHLIVEQGDGIINGMFYCHHDTLPTEFHPDEIVSHLILKDLQEYPSVHCCHQ
jgi:hypothetical protein